jgi:hypothetical protein
MSIPRVLDAARADGPTLRKEARGSLPIVIRHFRYPMANGGIAYPMPRRKTAASNNVGGPFPARI